MNKEAIKTGELTRGKAALIGGLLIAIVGVLWVQFGAGSSTARTGTVLPALAKPEASATANRRPQRLKPPTPPSSDGEQFASPVSWPTVDLADMAMHDPFELASEIKALMPDEELAQPIANASGPAEIKEDEKTEEDEKNASELLAKQIESQEKAKQEREAALLAAEAKHRSEVSALVKNGVAAIIRLGDERVALIGEKEVKVGDSLNGMRVVAIHDKGVELEHMDSTIRQTSPSRDGGESDNSGANVDNEQ